MRIIALIPARGGSKTIPLKNIRDFCEKPLIYWNLNALENCKKIEQVYVATDHDGIKEIVENFSFQKVKVYIRDKENAQDHSTTESVLLEFLYKHDFHDSDILILVQLTSPLTETSDFEAALDLYEKSNADSLLTCARMKHFFWQDNGVPINYDYNNRPRRQDFKGTLWENGAFYINTIGNIKKFKNRLSGEIVIYEMDESKAVDLDEIEDWMIAESRMKKCFSEAQLKQIKLFITDVDGVLTDAGMYYSEKGDELKKFNTTDGMGIELLRNNNIKTAVITSENSDLVKRRAKKLKIDYIYTDEKNKLKCAKKICEKENITLAEVAFIGDDINDFELLSNVAISACPVNALEKIKSVPGIIHLNKKGGEGAVREFIDIYLDNYLNK